MNRRRDKSDKMHQRRARLTVALGLCQEIWKAIIFFRLAEKSETIPRCNRFKISLEKKLRGKGQLESSNLQGQILLITPRSFSAWIIVSFFEKVNGLIATFSRRLDEIEKIKIKWKIVFWVSVVRTTKNFAMHSIFSILHQVKLSFAKPGPVLLPD